MLSLLDILLLLFSLTVILFYLVDHGVYLHYLACLSYKMAFYLISLILEIS